MLVYYVLLRFWIHMGDSEFMVRLLSVFPAVAIILIIYLLGQRLFSRKVGLISALLISVNACHLAYSQEARSYSFAMFLCALSMLYFAKAMEQSNAINWTIYVSVSSLAIYTHFFAGLIIIAQWLPGQFLRRSKIPLRHVACSLFAIAMLTCPVAWFVITKDIGQIDFIPNPGFAELYHLFLFFTANGGKLLGTLLALIYLISLWFSARKFWQSCVRDNYRNANWQLTLLWSWLLVPVAIVVGISHLGKELFYYRYLLVCFPAFIMLVSYGLCCLKSRKVLAITLSGATCLSFATICREYARAKEDWRAATEHLLLNASRGDVVVLYPQWADLPLQYYSRRLNLSTQGLKIMGNRIPEPETSSRSGTVWLLARNDNDGNNPVRTSLLNSYRSQFSQSYPGRVWLERYSLPADGIPDARLAARHDSKAEHVDKKEDLGTDGLSDLRAYSGIDSLDYPSMDN